MTALEQLRERREDVARRKADVDRSIERMGFTSTAAALALGDLARERADLDRAIRDIECEYIADGQS